MRRIYCTFICLLCMASSTAAFSQSQTATKQFTVSKVLETDLNYVEHEVMPAADAMPGDKYAFAPNIGEFKGVRTFAQEAKHIAVWNYRFGAAILQEKTPVDTGGENGPDSLNSKAEIMRFLRDSFAYLHKAILSIDEKNLIVPIKSPWGGEPVTRLGMAAFGIAHPYDEYGQMVEYLRMNGIIPPASRQ
jgi:hypothetical protein